MEDEKIQLFMKGQNIDQHILTIIMTLSRKILNKVVDYLKKVERVQKVGQAKVCKKVLE